MKRLFILYLCILSCTSLNITEAYAQKINSPKLFLALGDSYTIGHNVKPSARWPHQLANLLQKNNIIIQPPTVIAQTGWTSEELIININKRNLENHYHIVTLMIGVNDQFRGYPISLYTKNLNTLLPLAIELTGNIPENVIILSLPDWGQTPFAQQKNKKRISEDIDTFNNIIKTVAKKYGTHYIDITEQSRHSLQDKEMFVSDGLHPSKKMYKKWVEIIYPLAKKILAEN